MTIQVQAEVILLLSSRNGEPSSTSTALQKPDYSWPISPSPAVVLKEPFRGDEDLADDDTCSTASLSDCGSEVSGRTVSFPEEPVTAVYTRPFTPPEQVQELYYSQEETSRYVRTAANFLAYNLSESNQKARFLRLPSHPLFCPLSFHRSFRQDYRLERRLLSGESLFDAETDSPPQRRGISRVVVHGGDCAAVYDREDDFDTPEFWSGSITWW